MNYLLNLSLVLVCTLCSCSVELNKTLYVKTTAYTHSESDHLKYGKKTAIGTTLKQNSAAADWSIFPVGTILKINQKSYEVSDYGSALVKKDGEVPVVDLYMPSRKAMNQYGAKFVNIEVLKWGCFEKSREILAGRQKFWHCRKMKERIDAKL